MRTSESINELATALAKAQGEFTKIEKRKHAKIKTTSGRDYGYAYADISDVLAAVLPPLSKHGLSVVQPTVLRDGMMLITTRIMHAGSGQWLESDYPVCSLNGDHQKMGAANTYARRYALTSLLAVAADEDTDGVGAEAVPDKQASVAAAPVKKPITPVTMAPLPPKTNGPASLRDKARGMAREGTKAFNAWWHELTDDQCNELGAIAEELAEIGYAADQAELARA